ncbi:MAG: peptidoglycan bridge formation glycyltransferase FemA/FemB family protein [Bacilli bacterium]|nr:peptidoglycan bridge formation glycyltransferase FemA/FemB family protein [Bacilli bacterium]
MKFIENLTKKEYEEFWSKTPNNHFMQSYAWGKACAKNRNQEPVYVGLKDDDNKLVAAALLLKKKTPLNMCYFYCPRGYTMDFENKKILTEFTNKLKEFLKKENAIYLKLDPPLMYQEINEEANKIEGGKNNYVIYNNFINLGYKHKGFNKLYEGNQPRYTFRTYFGQFSSFDEVEKTFSKSFARPIKRSYNYDLEVYESKEVKTFHELIKIISERDGFNEYSLDYYQNVYDELIKDSLIKVFSVKINPSKLVDKFTEEAEKEKKQERKAKIEKDIEYFKEVYKTHKDEYTCASLICTYSKTGSWSLYIGNDEVAAYTGTVNRLYYEYMKDAFENGYEYADLFGVVGDPHTKHKNLAGIYEYKRKIGGDYIEFVGEFDLINKPIWYVVLPVLLKIYRTIKK